MYRVINFQFTKVLILIQDETVNFKRSMIETNFAFREDLIRPLLCSDTLFEN